MTTTLQFKIKPTIEQMNILKQMSYEYIDSVNKLVSCINEQETIIYHLYHCYGKINHADDRKYKCFCGYYAYRDYLAQ